MATNYGVTEKGFVHKPLDDILTSLNTRFQSKFGATFDVSPESPDGQTIGIFANDISECWDLAEAVFNGYRPGSVSAEPLDSICELTDCVRYVNRPTKVTVELSGDAGVVVPANTILGDGTNTFYTEVDTTIPGDVTAICTSSGELYVGKNTVTRIITEGISGFTGVNNPDEGTTGVNYESDPALRARRDKTTVKGSATVEAIYSALADLDLSYVRIRDNDTGAAIGNQPTGSIFVVVDGGTKNDIAQRIFAKKAGGVSTYGTELVQVKDSKGYEHPVRFSRSSDQPIFITGTFKRLPGSNLSSNDVIKTLQQAAVDYVNSLSPGEPVVWSYLFRPLLEAGGQIQIDSLFIGVSSNPKGTATISLEIDKRARTSTGNVVFTESA